MTGVRLAATAKTGSAVRQLLVAGYHVNGSAMNFGFMVAAALSLSALEFSYFSLAMTAYIFSAGIWRSIGSEAALLTFSSTEPPSPADRRRIRLIALGLGGAASLVLLVMAAAVPGTREPAVAMVFPVLGLSMVDAEQAMLLALGRAVEVTLTSAIPAIAMLGLAGAVAFLQFNTTVWETTLTLGGAVVCSYLVAVFLVRRAVRASQGAHTAEVAPIAHAQRTMLFEYVVMAGSVQLTSYLVAGISTVVESGAYRATILATSPLTTALVAIRHVVVVRLRRSDDAEAARAIQGWLVPATLAIGSAAAVLYIGVLLLGERLLGDIWEGARTAVLPMTIAVVATTPMTIASAVLGAERRFDVMVRLRSVQIPVVLSFCSAGAYFDGARGAAVGLAISLAGLTPPWVSAAFDGPVR